MMGARTKSLDPLTTCNACDAATADPGSAAGYCAACEVKARSGYTRARPQVRASTRHGRILLTFRLRAEHGPRGVELGELRIPQTDSGRELAQALMRAAAHLGGTLEISPDHLTLRALGSGVCE